MKKFSLILVCLFSFICLQIIPVNAISEKSEHFKYQFEHKGVVYHFNSQQDKTHFIQNVIGKNIIFKTVCLPGDLGYPNCSGTVAEGTTKTVKISTVYENDKLIGYHSPTWEAVSSYTLTDSLQLSFSVSLNYYDLNLTTNVSYNFSNLRTYSADASRRSKLAAFASFKIDKYRMTSYNKQGKVIKEYDYLMSQTIDQYSAVVYK